MFRIGAHVKPKLLTIVARDDLPGFQELWKNSTTTRSNMELLFKRDAHGCDPALMEAAGTPSWSIALLNTTEISSYVKEILKNAG